MSDFLDLDAQEQQALLDEIVAGYEAEVGRNLSEEERAWARSDAIGALLQTCRQRILYMVPAMRAMFAGR